MADFNRWGTTTEQNQSFVPPSIGTTNNKVTSPTNNFNRWGEESVSVPTEIEEEVETVDVSVPDAILKDVPYTPQDDLELNADERMAIATSPEPEVTKQAILEARNAAPEVADPEDIKTRYQESREFFNELNEVRNDINTMPADEFEMLYGKTKDEIEEEDDKFFAELGTSIANDLRKAKDSGYESFGLFDYALINFVDDRPQNTRAFMDIAGHILSFGSGAVDQIENSLKAIKKTPVAGKIMYKGIEYTMSQFGRKAAAKNEGELAEEIAEAVGAGFEFAETTNPVGQTLQAIYKAREFAALSKSMNARVISKNKRKDSKVVDRYLKRSPIQAMGMTREVAEQTRIKASRKAAQHPEITNDLILDAEERLTQQNNGVEISISKVENGKLVIDPDKIREVGDLLTRKVADAEEKNVFQSLMGTSDVALHEFAELVGPDEITSPVLNPDKFDAIVSVAAEFKDMNPDAFKGNKRIIDQLYDYTVSKDIDGQKIVDVLDSYGLSFEEYVLVVAGTGSKAGKILQKLGNITRRRPSSVKKTAVEKAQAEALDDLRKTVTRFEGARLGILVSKLATTARNVTSVLVRAPLEGFANAFETALYNKATKKQGMASSLLSGKNWRDSFKGMSTIFDGRPDEIAGYTDLILNNPEVSNQLPRLLGNLNGIQEAAGRGKGTFTDTVILSPLEDVVEVLNSANRWSEHLIRRATFFGEMQRLTKRDWDIDLIDVLQQGKIKSLLNDSSEFKPKDARSFIDIIDESTGRALDATFGDGPEIQAFRDISNFITRNGLTVFFPFPRFMFKSMEVMAEYGGGAMLPLTRKIVGVLNPKLRGPLTKRERMLVSRNIAGGIAGSGVGLAALSVALEDDENPESARQKMSDALMSIATASAAYLYRSGKFGPVPEDVRYVYTENPSEINKQGTVLNTEAQFPLAQYLYLGESIKQIEEGTWSDWFNARDFIQKFTGSNFRTGSGNIILDELAQIADQGDLVADERKGEFIGNLIGNYFGTWLTPLGQVVDAQRATGMRGLEKRDVRPDPSLGMEEGLKNALTRTTDQMGVTLTAEEEGELPLREFLFSEKSERRNPMGRLLLGLSQETGDEPWAEYLKDVGFKVYDFKVSDVPSLQRYEIRLLREEMPLIVESAQAEEEYIREDYSKEPQDLKNDVSENKYVKQRLKEIIKFEYQASRKMIRDYARMDADGYINELLVYEKLPRSLRKIGMQMFRSGEGRRPFEFDSENMSPQEILNAKEDDLWLLNDYIKEAEETYRQ